METHTGHQLWERDQRTCVDRRDTNDKNSNDGFAPEFLDVDSDSSSTSSFRRRPASLCERPSPKSHAAFSQTWPNSADQAQHYHARHLRLQQLKPSKHYFQPFKQKVSRKDEKGIQEKGIAHISEQERCSRIAERLLRSGLREAYENIDRISAQLPRSEDCNWQEEDSSRLSAGKQSQQYSFASGSISVKKVPPSRGLENELLTLVENGSLRAMSHLGRLYFRQKKYAKAYILLKRCPEWDLEAQYRLGVLHFDGLETKPNLKLAVKCMSRVANADPNLSGIPEQLIRSAQYFMGTAYYGGFGVSGSEEKAVKWWRLASQDGKSNGNVQAQIALGLFYSDPWHKDVKEAFYWHQCADRNGGSASTAPYAVMCQQGLGTKKQLMQALFKLKEAVLKHGNTYAAGNIIAFYFQRKLYNLAAHIATNLLKREREHGLERIYSQSELKGLALAYFYLGRCHQLGLGARKDEILAMRLFKQAVHMDIEIVHPLYFDWIYGLI